MRAPSSRAVGGPLLGLAAAGLAGCAEAPGEGWCDAAPRIELYSGDTAWTPILDGDAATMVHGPQDGWHFLAGVEVFGLSGMLSVIFDAADAATRIPVANTPYRWMLEEEEPCHGRSGSLYAFLDVRGLADGELDTPPEVLAWKPVDLQLTIADESGRSATHALTVEAEPDPMDLPDLSD